MIYDLWAEVDRDLDLINDLIRGIKNTRTLIAVNGTKSRMLKFKERMPKKAKPLPTFESIRNFINDFFSRHSFPQEGLDLVIDALAKDYAEIDKKPDILRGNLKLAVESIEAFNERIKKSRSAGEICRLIDSKRQIYDFMVTKLPTTEFEMEYSNVVKALDAYLEKVTHKIPDEMKIKAIKELDKEVYGSSHFTRSK